MMKENLLKARRLIFIGILAAAFSSYLNAQTSKVPINFTSFHGYTGTVKYLKEIAKAYPGITKLETIGESGMGRPVYVLIISNVNTGNTIDQFVELRNARKEAVRNVAPQENHLGKPGQWICGATHGNEYTGTEVCLYIIDKLVSLYGNDAQVTDVVDNQVFYVCPVMNPDGVFNSVEKGIPQRSNSLMKDDDKDGKINEDGPEDMNGDGLLSWFRYKDKKGRYVLDDQDPRLMVRIGPNEKTDKERYSMVLEGIDNDKDGKVNEDDESGFDLNRNYPEGWFTPDGYQGGTGDYATSAPETQAVAEFFVTHPNIHQAQFFHTSGGFTYRPMGSSSDDSMQPEDIAVYDFVLGKKYVELIGETIPDAWENPDSLDVYKRKLKNSSKNKYAAKRGYEMPTGWVVSWNETEDKRYSYGLQADWAYMQLGIFSLTTELFSYRRDLPGQTFSGKDARNDYQRAALKYQEENFGGRYFVDWTPAKHDEFGEGEVGGWLTQYGSNNSFPGEMLESICETHWQYEKFRAGLMPRVNIVSAEARVLEQTGNERVVEVKAKIENSGQLATHLAVGQRLPLNRQDVVWLIGDRDKVEFLQGAPWQTLGFLGGAMKIPEVRPRKNDGEVKWIVRIKGNDDLKVVVTSQRGGTAVHNVEFK
jgi:hypothetical protein